MAYKITDYSKNKIAELNAKLQTDSFSIKPSSDKSKKLDVFLFDDKIASIGGIKPGGIPYLDYPNYVRIMGQAYADKRNKLYQDRHSDEPTIKDGKVTNSWWAKYLLWK
tara:strand:- start:405 stop:731 length:327 start_codon:yes stop_codon:yes gene_type:complete